MSKEDVIEMQGTVVRIITKCNVSSWTWKWSKNISTYFRKIKNEFYKNIARW